MMRISVILFLIFIGSTNILKGQSAGFFDYINFRIIPLTVINTTESDISPVIVKGDLFFSSEQVFENEKREGQSPSFYNIFRTKTDEKGNPLAGRELVPGFGNPFHEGPASWCEATGELFVTVSSISGESRRQIRNQKFIRLRLVIMKEVDGKWVVKENFPFNNDEYHFAHPAISVTGDTLVFSSDIKGGFGNSDLYMSIRKAGQWSEPKNLGKEINTPENELFPTFGPGGLLLFSSNGQKINFGQQDIYYTSLEDNIVVNLGEKINSEFDDFGLVIHPSGKFGYFSSNRYSWRKDDIFQVEIFPVLLNIRGKVVANHKDEPIQDATVYLEDCAGNEIKSAYSGFLGNFDFQVPQGLCYQVHAEKVGFESDLKSISGNSFVELRLKQIINYQLVVKDFENETPLENVETAWGENRWKSDPGGVIKLKFDSVHNYIINVVKEGFFDYAIELDPKRFVPGTDLTDTIRLFRKAIGRKFLLKTIEYYTDMWRIMPRSEPELNQFVKLMMNNPTLKFEISSHTDSRLEDMYNMWLSQKRADSVLEYLVQKGISKDRLVAKGYGETQLLNHCANGVNCTDKQHLVNKRTEFVILDYK
jgi:outer membrane protein OmpA-like peptidoglycan-associated protein